MSPETRNPSNNRPIVHSIVHTLPGYSQPNIFTFQRDLTAIATLSRNILQQQVPPSKNDFEFILAVVERLLGSVNIAGNTSAAEPADDDDLIVRLFEYLNKNLDNPALSPKAVSRHLGMSRAQMNRKIKQLTGKSLMENLRLLRLEKAAQQLKETEKGIADIAYSLGFTDPNYFTRAFTKQFGNSPSAFRKKNSQFPDYEPPIQFFERVVQRP